MSPITLPHRIRPATTLTFALTALVTISACGCARTPTGVTSSATGSQLVVTITFAAPVNPNYYYFVFFNPVTNPNQFNGPAPVVSFPWGTPSIYALSGQITAFMEYTSQPQVSSNNGYGMYTVAQQKNSDGSFSPTFTITPARTPTQVFVPGGSTTGPGELRFQIPLSEIPSNVTGATYMQINFMVTDNINMPIIQNGQTRNIGLLGSGGNLWFAVPITGTQGISSAADGQAYIDYPNGNLTQESTLPSFQITGYSIQVLPS